MNTQTFQLNIHQVIEQDDRIDLLGYSSFSDLQIAMDKEDWYRKMIIRNVIGVSPRLVAFIQSLQILYRNLVEDPSGSCSQIIFTLGNNERIQFYYDWYDNNTQMLVVDTMNQFTLYLHEPFYSDINKKTLEECARVWDSTFTSLEIFNALQTIVITSFIPCTIS